MENSGGEITAVGKSSGKKTAATDWRRKDLAGQNSIRKKRRGKTSGESIGHHE